MPCYAFTPGKKNAFSFFSEASDVIRANLTSNNFHTFDESKEFLDGRMS